MDLTLWPKRHSVFEMENGLIQVNLFASLRQFLPEPGNFLLIGPGQTVRDILAKLHVPLDEVKLVFINGKKADLDSPLKNQDRLGIFPPIGGG